jgi:hypothetical protein
MLHVFSTNVVKIEKVWPARFSRRLFIWDGVVTLSHTPSRIHMQYGESESKLHAHAYGDRPRLERRPGRN